MRLPRDLTGAQLTRALAAVADAHSLSREELLQKLLG